MGIPKFFRWLTRRYPMILQNIQQEEDCPPSDNLYLDLNSIVHNSIHGNDPKRLERISLLGNFEEVWADIMRAIDEIVHMVKPKKFMLLAVDGVAPRAKMNQQRARRFRSAKDALELREQLISQGKDVHDLFDSNQISPGTEFMHKLGKNLEWFIKFKLNTDPIYQNCERVVLSDSSVPGEGEHKMMDYIRNLKISPDYDPNTRHCFYGSDADLIMLSLLTHEPHFMIIREEHIIKKTKQGGVQRIDISRTNNLQLIHISILREYFMLEYKHLQGQMKMRFDLERIIDDFIFFCFFIGNDFLPGLSALDIGEGSLDHLINFYKKCLPDMKDYVTFQGQIFWDRAEPFIDILGKHEHQVFINRVKTLDQKYHDSKNLVTFDSNFQNQVGHMSQQDRTNIMQKQIQNKVKEKKAKKVAGLFMKNQQKKYKKFLLLKKFDEDYKPEGNDFVKHQQVLQKFKKVRSHQMEKENQLVDDEISKSDSLFEVISGIKEEYLSDLNQEDIPNSDISDISDSEINQASEDLVSAMEKEQNVDTKIDLVKQQAAKAIENNHLFMQNFVKTYKEDANEAKRNYYQAKLKFDVKEAKGKIKLHQMLYRYLEGMQWVLYYYYRGAPHWRWYYPYHYAPMISDLGSNIVKDFLGGNNQITEFRTDTNCNANPKPYTPFQQLLCIFPVKSLKAFLPPEYLTLAEGVLAEYFPNDFDIDLNGRTLPWEAAILIPFVEEDKFIDAEATLFENGMKLSKIEFEKNTTSFIYPSFTYDHGLAKKNQGEPLQPTLDSMKELKHDFTTVEFHHDYEKCGTFGFQSALLEGVIQPCTNYPSLNWLGVVELDYTEKFVQKVAFKQCLAKIPQCKEDLSGAEFEDWIYKFAEQKVKELYVQFPYQIEGFPLYFEDPYSIYQINGDASTGQFSVTKLRQSKSKEEFFMQCKRLQATYSHDNGIQLGDKFNTLVTLSTVTGTEYDEFNDQVYKVYAETPITVPLNLCMRKRGANHYFNINERTTVRHGRIKTNQDLICFNQGLLGVMGKAKGKDIKNDMIKVQFDSFIEESKIHNPFLAENFLKREFRDNGLPEKVQNEKAAQKNRQKHYYGDQEIEQSLKLPQGIINRITGSWLVAFDQDGKEERQVVDCGLNIKNFTKKVHIPDYVRFVSADKASNNIYDEFEHNQHARGSKHIRKHWEYSSECMAIIAEYVQKFPEIVHAIQATAKRNKAMNSLFDIYPDLTKKEKNTAITQLKKVLTWIEELPVSKLPYVEMGFDTLDCDLINKLQDHNDYFLKNYGTINLDVKQTEMLGLQHVYQETFPYWCPPFANKNRVPDFRVGNRVLNLNSTLRQYIPFGARGTVVGKTDSKIVVMFDEQFLHGTNIYGHCEMYRGAQVAPEYLLNISREFARLVKENYQAAKKFQEKPLEGCAPFADENKDQDQTNKREIHILNKFKNVHHPQDQVQETKKPKKQPEPKKQQEQPKKQPEPKKQYEPKKQPIKEEVPVHKTQQNRPRFEEEKKTSAPVPEAKAKQEPKQAAEPKKAEPAPQMVYKAKVKAPEEEKAQPVSIPLGAQDGPLFKPLEGLKILDAKLLQQPNYQKIVNMQSEENKKADE